MSSSISTHSGTGTVGSISDNYQVLSDIEHILLKPGMYVGSQQLITEDMYIIEDGNIIKKSIKYIPALQRIYEEILLNAFDQTVRDGTDCSEIHVNIDKDTNTITVHNNGQGLPIVLKEELGCYIPEMVFGMLRSGSNYSDEDRITGGTNGLGAKIASIFSTSFILETADSERKKLYIQEWKNNMSEKSNPKITSLGKKKPYTTITFQPDLKYFKIKTLTDDMIALMEKRLIDIGFASHAKIKTFYNGENKTIKKTEDYMKLYCTNEHQYDTFIVDSTCERWTVGIMLNSNGFNHASFVNGIHTSLGGSHVDHVMASISKEVIEKLKTKKIEIKPSDVKNKLFVFLKSTIVNPIFDSQTKECLKMTKSKFGSEYIMSDTFKRKLLNSDLLKLMMNVSESKLLKDLSKTSGTKTSRLIGIKGLEDANFAGTSKSSQTKLILTEGLSAKTFAMSAITVIGRDRFGIFPLKGKPLNVRGTAIAKVSANVEICNIVKILGLKYGEKYTDTTSLRYGGVIALADSDSVTFDTPCMIKNILTNQIEIKPICEIYDNNDWVIDPITKKEYNCCEKYLVWSSNGWTKIKTIMRHLVDKPIYRVLTHIGCVDVTEDHSLLNIDATEITVKDCTVGETQLLHNKYVQENIFTNHIATDLAWAMGYFQADGSCQTDSRVKQTRKDGTIKYSENSHWSITCVELEPLKKLQAIFTKYYGQIVYPTPIEITEPRKQCTKCYKIFSSYTELKRHNGMKGNCGEVQTVFNIKQVKVSNHSFSKQSGRTHKYILEACQNRKSFCTLYRNMFYNSLREKQIPTDILNNSIEVQQAFIDGFYAGDGNKGIHSTDRFDGEYKTQICGLFQVLQNCGYTPSLNCNSKKLNVYHVLMSKDKGYNRPEYTIKKIIDVSDKYKNTYVYDFETENHHFHGSIGNMIVHNCDGSHITSLILNIFHYFWPELLDMGYLGFCCTPIVKVYQKKETLSFYTLNDYEKWLELNTTKQFKAKYFKGLGTSTAAEARDALENIDTKIITFDADELVNQTVNLAFDKKQTDERKRWLMERYDAKANIDRTIRDVSVSDYINKELIHFSYYDNQRSIPNVIDGLKPSQRKILYTAIKYLSNSEMKVAQFGAKVAEKTDYHHGEASLMGAIINMAQNYVGSTNINLLEPKGAFGSRLIGGNDAASPRYIFTQLSDIAKKIFDSRDSQLLNYLESDGTTIEPEWFVPVIPMILVNGAIGIGSGFSTEVLQYNPVDICNYLSTLLDDKKPVKNLKPWYRGFNGSVERLASGKYRTIGCYEFNDTKRSLTITELPIGVWTDDYKDFIESMFANKDDTTISDIRYGNSDVIVNIEIIINPRAYGKIREMDVDELLTKFKLSSKLSCTNMYLFNHEGTMTKYNNVYEILKEFYQIRLDFYVKRRDAIIAVLKYELMILSNKVKFIEHVKAGKIKLQKIGDQILLTYLINNEFDQDNGVYGEPIDTPTLKEFSYMIDMPIRSITNENAEKFKQQQISKQEELNRIIAQTAKDMWKLDLQAVVEANNKAVDELILANSSSAPAKSSSKAKRSRK